MALFATDGALENVLFEVEVKTMNGQNTNSSKKVFTFKASDFDWDSDPYMPSLDITDKIEVLGDYFSDSESDKRTITTFRMYADYESLVNAAFTNTKAFFLDLSNKGTLSFNEDKCPVYKNPSYKGKGMLSQAEREQKA